LDSVGPMSDERRVATRVRVLGRLHSDGWSSRESRPILVSEVDPLDREWLEVPDFLVETRARRSPTLGPARLWKG
jgi:hypothetical protein